MQQLITGFIIYDRATEQTQGVLSTSGNSTYSDKISSDAIDLVKIDVDTTTLFFFCLCAHKTVK